MRDLPLWVIFYGYVDWIIKSTGVSSAATDMRVAIISPYTEPALIGSTPDVGFIPVSDTFCNGDMPFLAPYIPIQWWVKWYPMIAHQKEVFEAIVNCGPFVPRDQTKPSWEITMGYQNELEMGRLSPAFTGNRRPLPRSPPMSFPIPIDTLACYKSQTRQSSDRRQCSTSGTGDVGCLAKEVLRESKKTQQMMNMLQGLYQEKETNSILEPKGSKAPKKKATLYSKPSKSRGKRAAPSSQEQAPQQKETEEKALLEQLQLQKQHQRVLKRGLKLLLGDVLPTPPRSPLGPPPVIIQGPFIPDLLFPDTQKKKSFPTSTGLQNTS